MLRPLFEIRIRLISIINLFFIFKMNNNLVIISGITVSLLVVILLFKLNKTKIEYDNKLLVLNRKVRDLTNLVDLSNTKNNLLGNGNSGQPEQLNTNAKTNTNTNVAPNTQEISNNTPIENQYQEFVSTNENFFNNLENFEAPIPDEVKQDIDSLVNENDMYSNLDSFQFTEEQIQSAQVSIEHENDNTNTQSEELPQTSVDEELNNVTEEAMGVEVEELEATEASPIDGISMEQVVELDSLTNDNFEVDVELENSVSIEELPEVDNQNVVENVLAGVEVEEVGKEQEVGQEQEGEQGQAVVEEQKVVEEESSINFEDLENMSVKDLQEICRQNKLKVKGRKDELIERIKEFFSLSKL